MGGDDGPSPEEAMVQVERPLQAGTWVCCMPCYWLRRSKAVHKALLTFAMLLVTSLLVSSPVLFLITTLPEGEQVRECAVQDEVCLRERDGQEGVCETDACHEASLRMLASLKRGVDPCKDFYQFACGGFRDRDPYQPSSSFSALQALVDDQITNILANRTGKMTGSFYKLGRFYRTCIDFKGKPANLTPVYQLLDELGGYLPPKSLAPADITPLVSALLRVNGAPLFDFYIDADIYDRTRPAIFLDIPSKYQAATLLPLNQTSMDEQRSLKMRQIIEGLLPKNMEAREKLMETNQMELFCSALNKIYPRNKDLYNWVDVDQRTFVAHNMTYLQESFGYFAAAFIPYGITCPLLLPNDHAYPCYEMEAACCSKIRWGTLLNQTLGAATIDLRNHDPDPARDADRILGNEDQLAYVYVTAPHYFRSLGKLLNRFSRRVIHNSLLLLYATDTLHDIVNATASRNWSDSCSKLSKTAFSSAVGALYVRQYTPKYLEIVSSRVTRLFERVKDTLAERMLVMPWLDDETRTQALLRLNALKGKFDVWPGFHNDSLIDREMTEVDIETDFFSSVVKRFKQIRAANGEILRRNMTEKWRHPFVVNAYYEASTNSIVIPMAMMIARAWSWDRGPAYAAYATLGSVIAHEILHAFDLHQRGQPEDSDTNADQWLWLTPEARKRLEEKIECVAKFYARSFWRKVQFLGNSVDVQFDWNITKNENMADIGALQISYQTWQTLTSGKDRMLPRLEALRTSQLFFISAAQSYCSNMTAEAYILSVELDYHTPHPERVNGIMMNSPAFAEAFRCPAGAKMNPQKKCNTW